MTCITYVKIPDLFLFFMQSGKNKVIVSCIIILCVRVCVNETFSFLQDTCVEDWIPKNMDQLSFNCTGVCIVSSAV